jgi:hypothetical protein
MATEPSTVAYDATVSPDGRAVLGPEAVALRSDLDGHFAAWGAEAGARAVAYPPVLTVEDLVPLDYFTNFPHLASVVGGLRADEVSRDLVSSGELRTDTVGRYVGASGHILPSAACYNAYIHLAGTVLPGHTTVTTVATCFRREDHYHGLRRLFAFTMREIICIGPRETVLDFLATHKARVTSFIEELGLPITVAAATDPFFDPNGARTLMQKLFPVKEEFVYSGELAIASVNFHRNFFGERCDIRLDDGSPAFTGCVAFGLERWLAALGDHFDHDAARTRKALSATSQWRRP